MSELRATPGPWYVHTHIERHGPDESFYWAISQEPVEDEPCEYLAVSDGDASANIDTSLANAHLIAAVPEMYAELDGRCINALLGMVKDSGDAEMWAAALGFMERRDELLRKARGESCG